jgi:hypothetical protein
MYSSGEINLWNRFKEQEPHPKGLKALVQAVEF